MNGQNFEKLTSVDFYKCTVVSTLWLLFAVNQNQEIFAKFFQCLIIKIDFTLYSMLKVSSNNWSFHGELDVAVVWSHTVGNVTRMVHVR